MRLYQRRAGERAGADWVGSDEAMLDGERREGLYVSAEAQEGGFVRPWQVLDPELF